MKAMRLRWFVTALVLLAGAPALPGLAQVYYAYVACGSAGEVALVRFDGARRTAAVAGRIEVGRRPTESEGLHGLAVSPDGRHGFVSIAHGRSSGRVVRYRTDTHEEAGALALGAAPASMQLSPATGLLYVVELDLPGGDTPGAVRVVDPAAMTEVARIPTGASPHGARLTPDGLRLYSVAMTSGELIEIDARSFAVTRRLSTAGGPPAVTGMRAHADTTEAPGPPPAPDPKPTWVQPHPTKPLAYVAHSGSDEVVEVDLDAWTVRRRFRTRGAPYHLDVTPDGTHLFVTQKEAGTTGVFDLERGEEVVRIKNSRGAAHGVALAPDGRYAFVSAGGVGGEPGAVDVIDLQAMERVATAETGAQAGEIAFWKIADE